MGSVMPLSTTNFSWEDPYGQKFIDAEIHEGNSTTVCRLHLDKSGLHTEGEGSGLLFDVLDLGEGSRSAIHVESLGNSHVESSMLENVSPLELIVEMQAVGVSVV